MTPGGLPHSDISGSTLVCSSPKLFAAYHVLHRLLAPRHSPCALSSLTVTPEPTTPARERMPSVQCSTHSMAMWLLTNYRLQDIQLSKNPPPRLRRFGAAGPRGIRRQAPAKTTDLAGFTACQAEAALDVRRAAKAGGEYRARTGDLLVANQALSQLS